METDKGYVATLDPEKHSSQAAQGIELMEEEPLSIGVGKGEQSDCACA
jgi:hypothetical protein